jgi:hypothetical protein
MVLLARHLSPGACAANPERRSGKNVGATGIIQMQSQSVGCVFGYTASTVKYVFCVCSVCPQLDNSSDSIDGDIMKYVAMTNTRKN